MTSQLHTFLHRLRQDVYPEPISDIHNYITNDTISHLSFKYNIKGGVKVLDVGCGYGYAMDRFKDKNMDVVGITLDHPPATSSPLCIMDQSFLGFKPDIFDLVWCRHCLEHSIMPYFTLHEFYRVLKKDGFLYIEVPAPDTSCMHQTNPNHYSVLGKSMWYQLIYRCGFTPIECTTLSLQTGAGPDEYYTFFVQKNTGNHTRKACP